MFYTKTLSGRLNIQRLDADFYRPDYLSLEERLFTLPNIPLGKIGQFFSGPFGSKLPSNLYLDKGIPLFRVSNVGQFEVLLDGMAYLDENVHQELITSEVRPGDLLVVKASVGEKICKVPEWLPKANITQHIIGIRPNGICDTDYVSAFLFSSYGVRQLQRYSLGSIIQYLGITDAKSVILYNPKSLVQKYIGDKVRQAELLREWAKCLRAQVDNELNKFSFATDLIPSIVNKVSTQFLEDRLDPRPYRNHYINLVDQIKKVKHSTIGNLATLNSGCPVSSSDFLEEKAVPLIRIRNIGYDDFIGVDTYISKSLYEEEGKYQAVENMIVIGMDGIFRAQFILSEELPMLINQRVAMLKPSDIRSELLTHWLNRPEGQMQLNQWAVKTTVEHTSLSDIGRVLIPRLSVDVEDSLADKLRNARKALKLSKALVSSAKYLVENLIEEVISEDQLIQAQNALEQGDNTLYRAILSKMTEDGYAVAGSKQLFADLDEFYELLEQAKEFE